jgi:hypothetical protein
MDECAGEIRMLRLSEIVQPNAHEAKESVRAEISPSRSESAIAVSSSQDAGGTAGVWLRVCMLNSFVFSFRITVRAMRASVLEADQTFPQVVGSGLRFLRAGCLARTCPRLKWILSACPESPACDRCHGRVRRGGFHSRQNELRALPARMPVNRQLSERQSASGGSQ